MSGQLTFTITEGPERGTSATLEIGQRGVIGRSDVAWLRLSPPMVSWEHAAVTHADGAWVLENLSSFGTRVNGEAAQRTRLRQKDVVALIPGCSAVVSLTSPGGGMLRLVVAAVVSVALCAALLMSAGGEPPSPENDWLTTELKLAEWLKEQKTPITTQMLTMLREGQRQERAARHRAAAEAFANLLYIMRPASVPGAAVPTTFMHSDGKYPDALDGMLKKAPASAMSGAEQHAAALMQLARRSHIWNAKQGDKK